MLEHVAIWTRDLEGMKEFYCAYFDGKAGGEIPQQVRRASEF